MSSFGQGLRRRQSKFHLNEVFFHVFYGELNFSKEQICKFSKKLFLYGKPDQD